MSNVNIILENNLSPISKTVNLNHKVTEPNTKKSSKIVYQGQAIIDYVDLYPLIKFDYTLPLPQLER